MRAGRRSGNTLVEYGILGSIIAVALIGTVMLIGKGVDGQMKGVHGDMDKNVQVASRLGNSGTWDDDDPDLDKRWKHKVPTEGDDHFSGDDDDTFSHLADELDASVRRSGRTNEDGIAQANTSDEVNTGLDPLATGPGGTTPTTDPVVSNKWNFKNCQPGDFCAR